MGEAGDGMSGVEAGTEATMDSTKLERKPCYLCILVSTCF